MNVCSVINAFEIPFKEFRFKRGAGCLGGQKKCVSLSSCRVTMFKLSRVM